MVDPHGLVAYWPGSNGYVSLTAWVVQFLVEAKAAGFRVDDKLMATLTRSLEQSLRSDYGYFIDGEAFAERCWALAALAAAGKFDPAYAAELARKAQFLDLEGVAEVLQSFAKAGDTSSPATDALAEKIWNGVVLRLYQGKEIYGGLQKTATARNGLILPTETRTVAEMARALAQEGRQEPEAPAPRSTPSSPSAATTAGAPPTPMPRPSSLWVSSSSLPTPAARRTWCRRSSAAQRRSR